MIVQAGQLRRTRMTSYSAGESREKSDLFVITIHDSEVHQTWHGYQGQCVFPRSYQSWKGAACFHKHHTGPRGRITCKPNRNSMGTCFGWGSRKGGSIKSFQEPLCCIIGPPSIWSGRPKGGQIGRTLPMRLRRAPAQHETVKLWGRHVIR
jgi:hypothetical protein